MALIACPECKKEISDQSSVCPHCGYPIIQKGVNMVDNSIQEQEANNIISEDNLPNDLDNVIISETVTNVEAKSDANQIQTETLKIKKKPVVPIVISAVIVLIVIVSISMFINNNNKNLRTSEYIENLESAKYTMFTGALDAENSCNLIKSVWYNTIFEESDPTTDKYTKTNGIFNDDFNDSLATLFISDEFYEYRTSIIASQGVASDYMKKLQSPPEGLENCYDTICDLYEQFSGFTDLALNPKGSLQTFNQSFSSYDSTFMTYYNKLETQIPTTD